MDNGLGTFVPIETGNVYAMLNRDDPKPGKHDGVYNPRGTEPKSRSISDLKSIFMKGEEIETKGSRFKITAIGSKGMTLKLLPKEKGKVYPQFTTESVVIGLEAALGAAVKDYRLFDKIKSLIDEVENNTIEIDWHLAGDDFTATYRGIDMKVTYASNKSFSAYSFSYKFGCGEVNTLEEAEEMMIRGINKRV